MKFTLIEIMIVVAIIGMIAAYLVPKLNREQKRPGLRKRRAAWERSPIRAAFAGLMIGCAALGPVAFVPQKAEAQVTPTSINVATNIPAFWLTAASTNITSYIPVRQGKSLSIQWQFSLSGSGTDNNQLYLRPRIDGTNITTLMPTVINAPGNGTTTVTAWTNLPATTIQGITDFAITMGSNGTARTLYESNIVYSYPP